MCIIEDRLSQDVELLEDGRDIYGCAKPNAPLATQAFLMHDRA
jgi:hypothetical protein